MSFIVKNVRDHAVAIGETIFAPGEQLTFQNLPPELGDALDRGDLTVTNEVRTHIDLKPFHVGDTAIDG